MGYFKAPCQNPGGIGDIVTTVFVNKSLKADEDPLKPPEARDGAMIATNLVSPKIISKVFSPPF